MPGAWEGLRPLFGCCPAAFSGPSADNGLAHHDRDLKPQRNLRMPNLQFSPVSLELSDAYYNCWQKTPRRSLDYTLANLWGWQKYYGLEWAFAQDLCFLRQTLPRETLWAPLGDWRQCDWPELFKTCHGGQTLITRVPAELANIWQEALPANIQLQEDRGQWEYLYAQADLATLSGNRFHKKRNHYNSYVKTYGNPDYQAITPAMVDRVLEVQEDWCHSHECDDSPSLMAENDAIRRVLSRWSAFHGLVGGTLLIDGKMVAFSVGEPLDAATLGVHFEKGLMGYKGVYQAMNLEFASHAGAGFKWINRAQDLGEEGLRQTKLTYQPADYLRKFKVIYNP